MQTSENPFRIGGLAKGYAFANRENEVARIRQSLIEPGGKLLVHGRRRMGKSSAIVKAVEQLRSEGGIVARADLSTPSSLLDMANVILREVTRAVGGKIGNFVLEALSRINVSASMKTEPATGLMMPSLDFNLRGEPLAKQKAALTEVLDAIEQIASRQSLVVGLVLDEFQEIHRFEEDFTEWNLRSIIEQHQCVSYVLAGSRRHLIERMMEADRGFYRMFDKLTMEPIDADYLIDWIGVRLTESGVRDEGAAESILHLGGACTHDRMRLARHTFNLARGQGRADTALVQDAFQGIIAEDRDEFQRMWEALPATQQNVLRAISMEVDALSSAETIARYTLKSTSSVANTVRTLVEKDLLLPKNEAGKYPFDNPFFEAWVQRRTEIDMGISPES